MVRCKGGQALQSKAAHEANFAFALLPILARPSLESQSVLPQHKEGVKPCINMLACMAF